MARRKEICWYLRLMWPFKRRSRSPTWVPFTAASFAEAERLGLGPGDGISVRLGGREVPMDLWLARPDCFIALDPDKTSHLHMWDEAVSYWKRV